MSSWAKPGVKCVLVFHNPNWGDIPFVQTPELGIVYTVAEVLWCDGEECLRLVELPNTSEWQVSALPPIFGAPVFGTFRFRPLVNAVDDLALFTHHLDRVGEPA